MKWIYVILGCYRATIALNMARSHRARLDALEAQNYRQGRRIKYLEYLVRKSPARRAGDKKAEVKAMLIAAQPSRN